MQIWMELMVTTDLLWMPAFRAFHKIDQNRTKKWNARNFQKWWSEKWNARKLNQKICIVDFQNKIIHVFKKIENKDFQKNVGDNFSMDKTKYAIWWSWIPPPLARMLSFKISWLQAKPFRLKNPSLLSPPCGGLLKYSKFIFRINKAEQNCAQL